MTQLTEMATSTTFSIAAAHDQGVLVSQTEWNTTLPTALVIGWTTPNKVTNEQIETLLRAIDASAGRFRYETPVEIQYKQRAAVREWLAAL